MELWNISGPKCPWDFAECHSASVSPLNHTPHNNIWVTITPRDGKIQTNYFLKGENVLKLPNILKKYIPQRNEVRLLCGYTSEVLPSPSPGPCLRAGAVPAPCPHRGCPQPAHRGHRGCCRATPLLLGLLGSCNTQKHLQFSPSCFLEELAVSTTILWAQGRATCALCPKCVTSFI